MRQAGKERDFCDPRGQRALFVGRARVDATELPAPASQVLDEMARPDARHRAQ
jgi:hypothetical protein